MKLNLKGWNSYQVCWLIHHLLMTVSYCLKLLVEYLNKYTTSCFLWFSVLISSSYIWKIYHKYYKPIVYLHRYKKKYTYLQKFLDKDVLHCTCIVIHKLLTAHLSKLRFFFFPFHNFIILVHVHVYYLISALHTEIWIISLD